MTPKSLPLDAIRGWERLSEKLMFEQKA